MFIRLKRVYENEFVMCHIQLKKIPSIITLGKLIRKIGNFVRTIDKKIQITSKLDHFARKKTTQTINICTFPFIKNLDDLIMR